MFHAISHRPTRPNYGRRALPHFYLRVYRQPKVDICLCCLLYGLRWQNIPDLYGPDQNQQPSHRLHGMSYDRYSIPVVLFWHPQHKRHVRSRAKVPDKGTLPYPDDPGRYQSDRFYQGVLIR